MPLGRCRKVRWAQITGTHQLLAYADDANLLGDNKDTIHTETFIDAIGEVGINVNVEKSMCWCLVTRMQIKIGI
jgi:hypothetical protein